MVPSNPVINQSQTGGKTRLLVIDSDPDSREYLEAYLVSAGYEVASAATGEEGLKKAQEFMPAAIAVQLDLPDMNGEEVCLALKTNPETVNSVILMLMDEGMDDRLKFALEAGADDFLKKPFRSPELEVRLAARLRHRSSSWRPEEQEALLDLTRMLASSLDMNQLLHLVAVKTAQVLQVDRCSFVLISPDGEHAKVAAASESVNLSGIQVSLKNYPEIQEVIRTQRPFVVERVENHPALKGILPMLIRKGVGSLALFPMIHEDKVDGVLFLRSERFRHSVGERDIFFASAVAAAVALALRNMEAMQSERKATEELQRTKQFMENLIDSSVDAIIAANMEGDIILFNKGAERIFGYKAEEVVDSLHVTALYPPGVAYEVMELLRRDTDGGKGFLSPTRKEVVNKSGETIPIHLTAWIVSENGREVATAGIFTDLRERLKIERKLSQAQEKLLRTEKQAMIAELAGATAHELNQPLTSVLGYAELAKRKIEKQEEVNRILDIILAETERMADIVRKIGRITRYETKSYVGEQRIVDIERSSDPE
jgi:PAS domain S-box-containing protein